MCSFHSLFPKALTLPYSQLKTLKLSLLYSCLILLLFADLAYLQCTENCIHTNEFAVQISGGEAEANELAVRHGFVNRGQIGSLKGYYLLEHNHVSKRSASHSIAHSELLQNDPLVLWVEQQQIKRRVKRSSLTKTFTSFSDPLYSDQWFLHGGSYGGYDMNVLPAWKEGYTGKGVVVSILDDGIQTNHPDLIQNYDKNASWDINDSDDDPTPKDNGDNKHGTRCAGEVAATAGNEYCGVGIAYNASIGGVRMLDGSVTDYIEAFALSLNPNHIHIYSASWGPEDDGKTVDGPGELAKTAFTDGINKGRGGLGSIFVWASGNGGRFYDSCNCDGYTNSIYTISISSATQSGTMPWYLEQCSSTLATTYSSGTGNKDKSIVTVDVDYTYSKDPNIVCTESHTGTSASAPIAAAICALALEANPKLTWRDMQYLVLMTSRPEPLANEDGWVKNGVGRQISSKFGYGLMDAAAMVKLAKHWKTLPPQHICSSPADETEKIIPWGHGEKLESSMNTTSCMNTENAVLHLEHVQVKVALHFRPRGNLRIILISPSGTPSTILLPRLRDAQEGSFNNWPFMSVHFWGENPEGNWKLVIINDGGLESSRPGKLIQWSLVFYGTATQPVKHVKKSAIHGSKYSLPQHSTRGVNKLFQLASKQCSKENRFQVEGDSSSICYDKCPDGQYGDRQDFICHFCDNSCQSCYGPSSNNCLSCPEKSFLSRNICIKSCPDGYFAYTSNNRTSNTVDRQCYPCLSACKQCQYSQETCSSCKPGLFMYNQKCLATCPSGTYVRKHRCEKCHESCSSCSGPTSSDCLSCRGNVLFNSTCILQCPRNYYVNNDLKCVRCHRSCKSCRSNITCIDCQDNWQRGTSGRCIWIPRCESDSSWENSETGACAECNTHCEKCFGPEISQCVECANGFYWSEGECVRTCPEGSFPKIDECSKCGEMCAKCIENDRDSCIECKEGFILHDKSCILMCPNGFYNNGKGECDMCYPTCSHCTGGSSKNCTVCHPDFVLIENTCQHECPEGFFLNSLGKERECIPCHHLCKGCTGIGSMQCTACPANSSFVDGACIPCLDDEFFNKEKRECQRCHDNCGRCYGSSDHNCLSCQAPLRLDEIRHYCLPCCDSEAGKDNECCTCSKHLDVCVSSSDHPRSIDGGSYAARDYEVVIPLRHIVPIVIAICASAVLLFVVLFGILQANSMGWCHFKFSGRHYERVPSHIAAKFDAEMEKISLTQDDLDDEDDIYEKA